MAYTAVIAKQTVHGDQRTIQYEITADAASGSVATGLQYIDSIQVTPISMATTAGKFRRNLNAASAAANGSVMVSSIASGDVFYMQVYGH